MGVGLIMHPQRIRAAIITLKRRSKQPFPVSIQMPLSFERERYLQLPTPFFMGVGLIMHPQRIRAAIITLKRRSKQPFPVSIQMPLSFERERYLTTAHALLHSLTSISFAKHCSCLRIKCRDIT